MKILIVDTYYKAFLDRFYHLQRELSAEGYEAQLNALLDAGFGTSNFYSRHLNALGCNAQDLIVNCVPLQVAWAESQNIATSEMLMKIPHRYFRVPIVGSLLSKMSGQINIVVEQIKSAKPDVLFCHDLFFFPGEVLRELKKYVGLIVGQIACPLPPNAFLMGYDLILTSFPHFVPRLQAMGLRSEYFRIGFDERVLSMLGHVQKDVDFSFVGGISRHHGGAIPLLEHLAQKIPSMKMWGYGSEGLGADSPIRRCHGGEVWGLDMYRALARSKITLNRHINVSENNANNMRLYEATGVGTLLLTDRKDNLGELFEIGNEIVTYSSKEEAAELIQHFLEHPAEAEKIAKAGQARTLGEHTYRHRMTELLPLLEKYLLQSRRSFV